MPVMWAAMLILVGLLAFANGANDVSRGVATLAGARVTDYRRALLWGTAWTMVGAFVGGVAAMSLAERLARILEVPAAHGAALPLSVVAGALVWVAFATRAAMPVSTTHAITGSIAGATWLAQGVSGLARGEMLSGLFAPLLLGPILALGLTHFISPQTIRLARWLEGRCVCVIPETAPALVPPAGYFSTSATLRVVVHHSDRCRARSLWGWNFSLDCAHWLSSGLVSLSRGLNDAPKIWALAMPLLLTPAATAEGLLSATIFLVAAAMGLGSWLAGKRVTVVLAKQVTPLNPHQGFAANLTTAILVAGASSVGLPVSTTHVSAGALIGVGLSAGRRAVSWRLVGEMAFAWLVTMPVAGLAAMACFALLQ